MVAQIDKTYHQLSHLKSAQRIFSYTFFEGRPLTTKGQWINPVIFLIFRFLKTVPQLQKVKSPVFIVGTGRSGTTILGIVMSMHRDVGFLNEPKALWHAIYPYEDIIGSYSQHRAFFRLNEAHISNETIRNAHHLYGAYHFFARANRVVDKYPELIFRIPFVKQIFPDAKFIFLIRNGWDTLYSIIKWSERLGVKKGADTHDWWGKNNRKWNLLLEEIIKPHSSLRNTYDIIADTNDHATMAVVEWIATMNEGLELLIKYPKDILPIKYENLTSKPFETLMDILDFCKLPNDINMFKYAKTVLKPNKNHIKVPINPLISNLFHNTMSLLGYE